MRRKVYVLYGSPNDFDKVKAVWVVLRWFGIEVVPLQLSAHRNADRVVPLVKKAREEGFAALVGAAGMANHLAGTIAAHTTLPVIGLPVSGGALNGVDSLYATVQMPPGVPVGTMAIDGAMNAGLQVVRQLAVDDDELTTRLEDFAADGFQSSELKGLIKAEQAA